MDKHRIHAECYHLSTGFFRVMKALNISEDTSVLVDASGTYQQKNS
jgi:hypothetical protein